MAEDFEEAFRTRFGVHEDTSTEEAFDLIEQTLHSMPKFFTIVWGNTGSIGFRTNFDNEPKSQINLVKRLRFVADNIENQAYEKLFGEEEDDVE